LAPPPNHGLSINWSQYEYLKDGVAIKHYTQLISSSLEFDNPNQPWYSGIEDQEGFTSANWIRAGSVKTEGTDQQALFEQLYDDYEQGSGDEPFTDASEKYEGVAGGTWAPYCLASYSMPNFDDDGVATTPAITINNFAPTISDLKGDNYAIDTKRRSSIRGLNNVDIVFTKDKSKWTRCPVVELGRTAGLNVGAAVPAVAATNASNSAKKTPEATKEYNAMLTEAQLIEKEITSEVAQYTQLKKESKNYQVQSEQALAKGNAAEADRLKKLADQKEEQALQSSMVIDNSRLEAKSKREEAKLYLQSLNPQVAKEVDAKSADKNTQTDAFVAYKEKSDKEVVAATPSLTAATTKAANPAQNTTAAAAKIDVANSPVFGGKSQDVQAAVLKDQFAIQSNVAYSAAQPIPVDVPLPEGLVYTVQVGAFRNPIPQDLFKGISPLFGEKTPMGFIRYTAGTFRSFKAAAIAKDKIRQMGYPDAFVVPYYNGKRISMDQADQVTAKADVQTQNALQVIEAREVESINKVEVKNPVAIAPVAAENRATSIDVSASDKLFYTVQIGVFSREIKKGSIYDMQPLNVERTTSGLLRYSVGKYDNLDAANKRKAEINTAGIADAFVIAYKGGQRIAVADAQAAGTAAGANTTVTATKNNSAATVNAANITFKVQVGAYAKDVPVETTTLFFNLPAKVEYYKDASGITIFNVGNFTSIDDARKLKDQVLAAGLTDAFIVAYQGKEKISVDKALELLKK